MKESTSCLEKLQAMLVAVQNHLDEDLSLERMAGMANMSPYHFHRVFTQTIGETPKKYTQRLRLERAAWQLKLRDATVLEIALDSGSTTMRHFRGPSRSASAFLRTCIEEVT